MFVQQPPGSVEHSRAVDLDDRILEDYMRSNPNARVIQRPDGKVVAIEDPQSHTRGALGLSGPPPPHGVPVVRGFAYDSGGGPAGYEPNDRQLPPPPALPAIREPPQPHESRLANNRSPVYHSGSESIRHSQSHSHLPHSQSHSHSHSSHRSRGSRHDLDPLQVEQGRLDTLPPAHGHVPGRHSRSSSLSGEGPVEPRSRRHDIHELTHQHGPVIPHARAEIPAPNMPTSPQSAHSPTHGRSHNHQRVGPGVHLHRPQDRDPELTRQLLREREKEKERDREREIEYHQRRAAEEEELRSLVPWPRDDGQLTGPGMSRARSRSDTPASGGGGGAVGPSRPDSGQSYERERERERDRHSYAAPRITNLLSHPRDTYYDPRDDRMGHAVSHSRTYPSEYAPSMESGPRKRSRHDMEIDDDDRHHQHSHQQMRSPSRSGGSADSYGMLLMTHFFGD